MGHFGVDAGVEGVVEGEESDGWFVSVKMCEGGKGRAMVPSPSEEGGEVRFVRWHYVLEVASGLVEEMPEDGAGDDVGGDEPAALDCGFDDCHATVALKVLRRLAMLILVRGKKAMRTSTIESLIVFRL